MKYVSISALALVAALSATSAFAGDQNYAGDRFYARPATTSSIFSVLFGQAKTDPNAQVAVSSDTDVSQNTYLKHGHTQY